jgi:hypothetical protein
MNEGADAAERSRRFLSPLTILFFFGPPAADRISLQKKENILGKLISRKF